MCFEVAHCAAALIGLVVTGTTGLFVGLRWQLMHASKHQLRVFLLFY